ncbi:Replication factor c subunit [Thalictrum thalictroides]|uniref:Replication factor c subunit n=1 Tax=Thalictrum thalictroides TaxID=46969 RepID=A0A7J6WY45_THATH|nr:Replication factor c subunit [Thalictrum thalictroides]
MPNPQLVIPTLPRRSFSDPNLSLANHSQLPLSDRSSSTTKRKGGLRYRRRHSTDKNAELTEESLEEFNKRNAAKKTTINPVYITRQKLAGTTSPGRESQGSTVSSISTVIEKIQKWSTSCFKGGKNDAKVLSPVTTKKPSAVVLNDSFSSVNTTAVKEAMDLRKEKSSSGANNDEKPLRERVTVKPVQSLLDNRVIRVEEKAKHSTDKNKDREFVWANKYRPKDLKDFICNKNKAEELIGLTMIPDSNHFDYRNNSIDYEVQLGECSHFIFEGPHGVGKRTMVRAMLREAFGSDKLMTREESKVFALKGEDQPSIKVNVQTSSQHVELNTSELGGYEKHVVIELIKEKYMIGLDQVMECDHSNCHAIILHEADRLSTDTQLYIRWLMDRNKGCNKIFFCCHDASKLQTIKSLCKVVQLLPPSTKEIVEVLEFIAEQEGIELPPLLAQKIAENSQHNLRQAIRSFEASWRQNSPLKEDHVIMTGWEEDIANIAKNIIEEQSPKQLYIVRGKLQSLIEHNVSPEFIFSTLINELKKLLGESSEPRINALYKEYNRKGGRMYNTENPAVPLSNKNGESEGKRKNLHQFLRIEEFTARFMSCYKSSLSSSSSSDEQTDNVNSVTSR